MSHDRGCYCGRDGGDEYYNCPDLGCSRRARARGQITSETVLEANLPQKSKPHHLTLDEIAEMQSAVQINISWCKASGFNKSKWGRNRIKSLDQLNRKLDKIIDGNCGHDAETECSCGDKIFALVEEKK